MGRKRFITSDISIDSKVGQVAEVSPIAALMWPWFLTALDDWARMTGNAREIKNAIFQVFPYTHENLQPIVELYDRFDLMHLYEVDGKPYLQANPQAFYALNTYIQKPRQTHDSSKIPPPPNHPWGRYWPTSSWPRSATIDEGVQQKAALSADKLHQAAKRYTSPSPSPSLSPSLIESEYEKEEERLRELPDELRDNWERAYQHLCVKSASATHIDLMQRFKNQAGITDHLIVHLFEIAIKTKRKNYPAWVVEVLTEAAANNITTPQEWDAFEKERETEQSRAVEQRAKEHAQSKANVRGVSTPQPTAGGVYDEIERLRPGGTS